MGWQTMLLTASTCFLAGTSYTHWIADHNTLWLNPSPSSALQTSLSYYSILNTSISSSYSSSFSSTWWLPYVWLSVCLLAVGSTGWRMIRGLVLMRRGGGGDGEESGGTGGFLFDGACTLLLLRVLFSHINDIYPAINTIHLLSVSPSFSAHHPSLTPLPGATEAAKQMLDYASTSGSSVGGKLEEVLRDLAENNLVVSVALTGVIFLQGGRYYSERTSTKSSTRLLQPTSANSSAAASLVSSPSITPREFTPATSADESDDHDDERKGKRPISERRSSANRPGTPYRSSTELEVLEEAEL